MDFPYFAILWDPRSAASSYHAAHILKSVALDTWKIALQACGIHVYIRNPGSPILRTCPINTYPGVILGTVFSRADNHPLSPNDMPTDLPENAAASETVRHLTKNYWGGYVAFINDPHDFSNYVLRDCSGLIPCYYTTTRSVTLVSSDARTFFSLSDERTAPANCTSLDLNLRYLSAFLTYSQLQIRETGLKGVHELLAGESLKEASGGVAVQLSWNPMDFAGVHAQRPLDEACASLRNVTEATIDAWASTQHWIVHCLSGGFDSSLVLALLQHSHRRPHVVCVNRYSDGPAEDERSYARIAAGAAGTPLVEWPWNFGERRLDTSCLSLPFGAKPSISALIGSLDTQILSALRSAHPFDSIWTGEGGDHLFLAITTELMMVDFLLERRTLHGFARILRDAARLTGRSIPHLIADCARELLGYPARGRRQPYPSASPFVSKPVVPTDFDAYIDNSWTDAVQNASPGKRRQVLLLAEVIHRNRPLPQSQGALELAPLLSQPLMEECLKIPTYSLLLDGRKRGLARSAFSELVPTDILNRELKGQTTHHGLGLLDRSLPFMKALLLDGELAQRNLINPQALKPILSRQIPVSDSNFFPLLACLAAEVWVRSWSAQLPGHSAPN